jgi:serine/threonine-protein kinase
MGEADLVPISREELIDLLEDAIAAFPDQPEAWYLLGDAYFHWGDPLGVDDPFAPSRADLERSYSLDSTFAVPLIHLVELAAIRRDTSATGLFERYVDFDSTSSTSAMLHLSAGAAVGDPSLVEEAFRIAAEEGDVVFSWTAALALQFGIGVDQVDSIFAASEHFVRTEADRDFAAEQHGTSLAVMGRPIQAAEALARAEDNADMLLILHALYSDLDDELVRDAVAREMRRAAAPPAESVAERRRQGQAACAVGQWKLWHGATAVDDEMERLGAGAQALDARGYPEADPTCLRLLEAMSAVNGGREDAERLVESLDFLLLTGPPRQREEYNLAASRLLEEVSSPARALAAVRRRSYDWDAPYFVAPYLRREGRLAELAGDRVGAIAAYSHYLKLREDPEPHLVVQRDSVQAALARLRAEPSR